VCHNKIIHNLSAISCWQVLNTSRLSKSGWAKIAHHLGRSGSSGVSGIKLKYRTLKEQADKSAGDTDNAATTGRDPPQTVCLPADSWGQREMLCAGLCYVSLTDPYVNAWVSA
jgi:hypothetical protein